MKYREKLGYIVLGGVLMLVGMLAAGLTSPIGAVNNAPDAGFGIISCQGIAVKDSEGKIVAVMGADETGGVVRVTDAKGTVGASMSVGESGGVVGVSDSDGKVAASMMVNAVGEGIVTVFGKPGTANFNALIPE